MDKGKVASYLPQVLKGADFSVLTKGKIRRELASVMDLPVSLLEEHKDVVNDVLQVYLESLQEEGDNDKQDAPVEKKKATKKRKDEEKDEEDTPKKKKVKKESESKPKKTKKTKLEDHVSTEKTKPKETSKKEKKNKAEDVESEEKQQKEEERSFDEEKENKKKKKKVSSSSSSSTSKLLPVLRSTMKQAGIKATEMKGLNEEQKGKRYKQLLQEAGFSGQFTKQNLKAFGNKKEIDNERKELNLKDIVSSNDNGRPKRSTRNPNASYNLNEQFKEVKKAIKELGGEFDEGDEEDDDEEEEEEEEELDDEDVVDSDEAKEEEQKQASEEEKEEEEEEEKSDEE